MTVPVGGFVQACTACNTTIWPACAAPLDVRANYPPAPHKIESVRKLTQQIYAVPGTPQRARSSPRQLSPVQSRAWRSGRSSTVFEGVRHWPIFSFNAPVPVCQSQPGSRASGFCSKACLASLYRCAAPPAVRCTNGCQRTHGRARRYPRRLRGR